MSSAPFPRRQFFKASAGGIVLGSVASCLGLPVWSSASARLLLPFASEKVMLQTLTHASFVAHLGGAFQLELEPGRFVALTLMEAHNLAGKFKSTGGERPEPFSLMFHAAAQALEQRIYTLHHETMGRFDLFLVPIGRDGSGLRCEAIFN